MSILIEKKLLFIHAPRTGGEWLARILEECNINFEIIGDKHATVCHNLDLYHLIKNINIKSMSFIRHPAEWYKSYWELKNRVRKHPWGIFEGDKMWHPTWDIDNECEAPSFLEFIDKCTTYLPSYVSYLYDVYTRKPPTGNVDYILLTENLEKEILKVFNDNNININEQIFQKIKNVNTFKNNNFLYTEEALNEVIISEKRCINKFNFTTDINKLKYLLKE